jgi:hypothetical protein
VLRQVGERGKRLRVCGDARQDGERIAILWMSRVIGRRVGERLRGGVPERCVRRRRGRVGTCIPARRRGRLPRLRKLRAERSA